MHSLPEFIRYNDVFRILHEKYKITHEELNYWIKRCYWCRDSAHHFALHPTNLKLIPYKSDIPIAKTETNYFFEIDTVWPFDATIKFYIKENVQEFEPLPSNRFVYIRQLGVNRSWRQWDRVHNEIYSNYPSLELGAKHGMLRFYDKKLEDFSYYRTEISGREVPNKELWYETQKGKEMLSDPDTFFLIEDIIHTERTFEMISREECIKSLGINIEESNGKD